MLDAGHDIKSKYKETARADLAVNITSRLHLGFVHFTGTPISVLKFFQSGQCRFHFQFILAVLFKDNK